MSPCVSQAVQKMLDSAPVDGERGLFSHDSDEVQHIADEVLQDMENSSQVTSKSGPDRPCAKLLRLCNDDRRKRQVTVLELMAIEHSLCQQS